MCVCEISTYGVTAGQSVSVVLQGLIHLSSPVLVLGKILESFFFLQSRISLTAPQVIAHYNFFGLSRPLSDLLVIVFT